MKKNGFIYLSLVLVAMILANCASGPKTANKSETSSKLETAEEYAKRAGNYSFEGKIEKAIADYTEAIRLNSNNQQYYVDRGYQFEKLKDYNKALADYNEVITLGLKQEADAEKMAGYYFLRGRAYVETRSYNNALNDLMECIALDPDRSRFYNYLLARGKAYRGLGNYDQAISDSTKAIGNTAGYEAFYERGRTYAQRSRSKANSSNQSDQLAAILDNQRAAEDYKSAVLRNSKDDAFIRQVTRDMDDLRK